MNKIILYTILILFSFITKAMAQKVSIKDSVTWSFRQTNLGSYEIGPAENQIYENQNVFTIKSIKSKINGFGNIMKTIDATSYQGKTVKMSGYIKTENVKSWAGLWMRADFYSTKVLSFDNMQNRGIKGSKDWTKYEVVLYVPEDVTSISYGVLLDGTGQIWMKSNLKLLTIPLQKQGLLRAEIKK
jgi:hypothetical protein